jgi:hypothetical protein
MLELRVECLASLVAVPDLNLTMKRGDVVWLPSGSLKQSLCLRSFQEVGAISVFATSRSQSTKPIKSGASTPPVKVIPIKPLPVKEDAAPSPSPTLTEDRLERLLSRFADKIISAVQREIRNLPNEAIGAAVIKAVTDAVTLVPEPPVEPTISTEPVEPGEEVKRRGRKPNNP